jgi:16S rRNA U516 pseudouridylate synthase RsuA-like enzyme
MARAFSEAASCDLLRLLLPYPSAPVAKRIAKRLGIKPRHVNAAVTRFRLGMQPSCGPEEMFFFVLHKDRGFTSHKHGDDGRTNQSSVYDGLPAGYPPVPHVGRLDRETEGLLLFTEDGRLCDALLSGGLAKTYHVLVQGLGVRPCTGRMAALAASGATPASALASVCDDGVEVAGSGCDGEPASTWRDVQLRLLRQPMLIDGVATQPAEVSVWGGVSSSSVATAAAQDEAISTAGRNEHETPCCWLRFTLREGRNRQIRRLCARSGLQVERLVRVAIGPLRLEGLGCGAARALTDAEVAGLYAATGLSCGEADSTPPRVLPLPLPLPLAGEGLQHESGHTPEDRLACALERSAERMAMLVQEEAAGGGNSPPLQHDDGATTDTTPVSAN